MAKIIKFNQAPKEEAPGVRTVLRFLDKSVGSKKIGIMMIEFEPKIKQKGIHYHEKRESVYIILEGSGVLMLNGETHSLEPELLVFIEPGDQHGIIETGENGMKMIEVWSPLKEDRINL
jgi:quercetin dioxygenase-like cupin family protein